MAHIHSLLAKSKVRPHIHALLAKERPAEEESQNQKGVLFLSNPSRSVKYNNTSPKNVEN